MSDSGKTARRRAVAISGLIGIVMAASACSSSNAASGSGGGNSNASGTPVKIGVTLSLTGPIAAIAAQELAGIKLAVQAINDAGGANGHQLALDITDDKYAPDQAVLNIRKLYQDGATIVVGPGSSNSTVIGGTTANSLRKPLLALPSTVGTIWDGAGTLKWAFGTAGNGGALGSGCYQQFEQIQKASGKTITKIAIGGEESPGPQSYIAEVLNEAKKANVQTSAAQTWGGDVTDLTTQINTLIKSNPDAIILGTQTQTNILALKALDQLGALGKIPVVDCSAVDLASWQKAVGALAEKPQMYLMALADDVYPAVKTGEKNDVERQALVDEFAKDPSVSGVTALSNFAGSGWDSIQLIANAIKLKGTTGADIRDGLEQGKPYYGATATVAYGPTQHRATYEDYAQVARLLEFTSGQPQLAVKQ